MKAVLLVPANGDPHGLLAPGRCGADVPLAVEGHWDGENLSWLPDVPGGNPRAYARIGCRVGLVLAWDDGEPCVEGCDRAARVRGCGMQVDYTLDEALRLANLCAARLGGEVIVLDAADEAAGRKD